ncbi:acyltransferase [Arthrobacter zhaoxinii]|uniref:acyltransferase n=1 Tax=Arthrobacter zhaoxinii TaxID=2964616 RepID=UPI0021025D0E|nr:acyltransferase [Arthrobacter zhaoxinii]MCQ2000413.1 acyltransferase [Arthrobacter zhaoxinii]
MVILNTLAPYSDENGNQIIYGGREVPNVRIEFTGSGNRFEIASEVRLGKLNVAFDCDNGTLQMAGNRFGVFSAFIRIGQDSLVSLGQDLTTTNTCVISAVEGTSVLIGNDVMLASDNEIRADDGHAIFDVATEQRVNWSKDIAIGNHVWVAKRAVLLSGAQVGDGSVVGFGSLVTGRIPNNCVAAGIPARVTRRDVAWERPHLSRARPFYKPDASTVTKSPYWSTTADGVHGGPFAAVVESGDEVFVVQFPSESEARLWAEQHGDANIRISPLMKPGTAAKHMAPMDEEQASRA